jgi:CheY-like chemotaxis protein
MGSNSSPEIKPLKKIAIVCVDDEALILYSLERELANLDGRRYNIELAENGPEALEIFNELINEGYDVPVVISDYIMPGMKGDELLKKIHQISPATLTVLLTGQAVLEGVTNAINHANLFKYIEKPWYKEELRTIVSRAMELYYQNQNLRFENSLLQKEQKALETTVSETNQELLQIQTELGTTEKIIAIGEMAKNLSLLKEYQNSLSTLKTNIVILKELSNDMISNDGNMNTYLIDQQSLYTETNAQLEKVLIAIRERNTPVLFDSAENTMLDLNECISHCIEQITGDINNAPVIKTEYGHLPAFCGDPRQMEFILSNLLMILSDSIEDPVEISVRTIQRDNVVEIMMEGSGTEIRTNVFTGMFLNPDLHQRHMQTIFQLSAIYQLIKEQNGDISLKSRAPSIITFTMELPVC